ncbi:hypothetical protein Tco_0464975 [Tanacetum coccineum]
MTMTIYRGVAIERDNTISSLHDSAARTHSRSQVKKRRDRTGDTCIYELDGHLSEWRICLLKSVKEKVLLQNQIQTIVIHVREDSRTEGPASAYMHLGDCKHACQHCGALFWYGEHAKTGHSLGRKDQ